MSAMDRKARVEAREKKQEVQGSKIIKIIVWALAILAVLGIYYWSQSM